MSRFIIPRGMDYTFTVQVLEEDSFIAQNLDEFDPATSTFKIINKLDGTTVVMPDAMPVTKITEDTTIATQEETRLTVPEPKYEAYEIEIKGQKYTLDNTVDIFKVTPTAMSLTPSKGDIVGEIDILSSVSLTATVSDVNGYYEISGQYVVLTSDGAVSATDTDEYTVTVGSNSLATSPGGSLVTNDIYPDAIAISAELNRLINLAAPSDVTSEIDAVDARTIIITEIEGYQAEVSKTSNIVQTGYISGVPAKDSNYYNDNGYLIVSMTSANTLLLDVVRGEKVDNYYLKSNYIGILDLKFTNASLNRIARIEDVYISYSGA